MIFALFFGFAGIGHAGKLRQYVGSKVWSSGYKLPSRATVGPQRPILILLHGVNIGESSDNIAAMSRLARVFSSSTSSRFSDIYGFEYDFKRPIEEVGAEFAQQTMELTANHQAIVVAYSQGGLIARWALEKWEGEVKSTRETILAESSGDTVVDVQEQFPVETLELNQPRGEKIARRSRIDARVSHLFTLGTPHFGIKLSSFLSLFKSEAIDLFGSYQLFDDSPLIKSLRVEVKSREEIHTHYHVLQGKVKKAPKKIPFAGVLKRFLFSGGEIINDGAVPFLVYPDLKKFLPAKSLEVVNFERTNHMDFVDKHETIVEVVKHVYREGFKESRSR